MFENLNDGVHDQVRLAISAIGPPAEPDVIQLLGSGDPLRRQTACEILSEIGGEETLKAMRKLRPDTVPSVRDAARAAMVAINNRQKLKN
jgi:HEAT repeat protein